MISRREFVAGSMLTGVAPAAPKKRRPNILFVLPDQLRAQAVGCYGNSEVQTPHIDSLAKDGLRFESMLANTPVCCAARAILLTGQYCHRNGMTANDLRLRESHTTLSSVLRQQGYRTGFVGKWHLDGGPRLPGFVPPGARRHGFEFWAANQCSHAHFKNTYFRDTPEALAVRGFEPEGWTDLTLEFLEGSKRDGRPFFLTVQMGPPHDPYGAPEEYMRRYDPAKLTPRPNHPGDRPGLPGRRELAAYYAATTAIDDQVGRMLKALDQHGMAEDTLVLFSSDHGDMLGSQGFPLKRKPWEESIRVPGIVRYPRAVKAGRGSEALWSHVDFAPTLLSLCGAPVPASMQGTDFSRVITGAAEKAPDSCYFQIFGPYKGGRVPEGWRGVRTRRYMYARFQSKPWVLYDLEKDPYELHNLTEDPAAAPLVRDMETRLQQWMGRTGDSWSHNWTETVEDGGRLYKDKTYYSVKEYLDAQGIR
jgi:arylsulfatase A-like enzyme